MGFEGCFDCFAVGSVEASDGDFVVTRVVHKNLSLKARELDLAVNLCGLIRDKCLLKSSPAHSPHKYGDSCWVWGVHLAGL